MNESEKPNCNKSNNMSNNLSLISCRVKMLTDIALILEGRYNDSDDNIDDLCKDLFTNLSSVKDTVESIRNYLKEQMDQTNSLAVYSSDYCLIYLKLMLFIFIVVCSSRSM